MSVTINDPLLNWPCSWHFKTNYGRETMDWHAKLKATLIYHETRLFDVKAELARDLSRLRGTS